MEAGGRDDNSTASELLIMAYFQYDPQGKLHFQYETLSGTSIMAISNKPSYLYHSSFQLDRFGFSI